MGLTIMVGVRVDWDTGMGVAVGTGRGVAVGRGIEVGRGVGFAIAVGVRAKFAVGSVFNAVVVGSTSNVGGDIGSTAV